MPVKIIGTSHIAKQSMHEIKSAIQNEKPDIVAIELDLQRATALMHEEKNKITLTMISKIGVKGFLFAKIGQIIQQKLGKMVGVSPGSDMKTALELAKKEKLEIALIDQPINTTLRNFSKSLTWKEKLQFLKEMIYGIFFPRKQLSDLGLEGFNLQKVPSKEVIKKMMQRLQRNYPSIYKALVSDRNKYMVKQLVKLMRKNPNKKILCVVGAGHKEGMEELLLKVEIVRN